MPPLLAGGFFADFFRAGLLKYESWEMTVMLFAQEYKVPVLAPELAARMAMAQELTVVINGEEHTSRVDGRTLLVHYLRDQCLLTGTKNISHCL